jgi:hypothetical protein
MSENLPKKQNQSDEIDLGVLFNKLISGINKLSRSTKNGFFSLFIFLKTNILWVLGAVIIGAAFGKTVEYIRGINYELNVIVTPNLDSKNYLYQSVRDIQAHLESKDTAFFKSRKMDINEMEGFEIDIYPLGGQNTEFYLEDAEIFKILKDSENTELIQTLLANYVQDQTSPDHKITFKFRNIETGERYSRQLLKYINSNPYYDKLFKVYEKNAKIRINANEGLVDQLDALIRNYTKKLAQQQDISSANLVLDNQEALDIPELFVLKNDLIRDNEAKRIELEKREGALTIVSFGKPRGEEVHLLMKYAVLFPLITLGLMLLVFLIKQLNKKAMDYLPH